jgi:hypothetical protein
VSKDETPVEAVFYCRCRCRDSPPPSYLQQFASPFDGVLTALVAAAFHRVRVLRCSVFFVFITFLPSTAILLARFH